MDNQKLSALMYIGAGAVFCVSAFLGGNIIYVVLGAVCFFLGLRKLKDSKQSED